MKKLPRNKENDHTREMAETRRGVVTEATGVPLGHIGAFSFDPAILRGNMESFCGVAQVPLGFAGPLLVDGEHAHGEFYVPMATTEGTLIASYNRGMRLTREAGGVRTTVIDDAHPWPRGCRSWWTTEADSLHRSRALGAGRKDELAGSKHGGARGQ